jgi:hypothetical protein
MTFLSSRIVNKLRNKIREKRNSLFNETFKIDNNTKILDLGGGNGGYITSLVINKYWKNITVADIDKELLNKARSRGLKTILLNQTCDLPFKDQSFDIIFCNSVLEHVTINKEEIWNCFDSRRFYIESMRNQIKFSNEIRRVAKSYFLQTPNKYFPLESHTWLPFVQYYPRKFQIFIIKLLNKIWFKKTKPDWNLLNFKDIKYLFPNDLIYKDKILGMIKSFVVIKSK